MQSVVLNRTELPNGLEKAVKGLEIAEALQESLKTRQKIVRDKHGKGEDGWCRRNGLDWGDAGEVGKPMRRWW